MSDVKRVKVQLFTRGVKRDGHLIALKKDKAQKVASVLKELLESSVSRQSNPSLCERRS